MRKSIAIFYEHPEWFNPLFVELERRDIPHQKLSVHDHFFDPTKRHLPYDLVVNRVSAFPSTTVQPEVVFYVQQYLAYLESLGTPVINGLYPFSVGLSKAMQLNIFEELNLRYPKSTVIYHQRQALAAAAGLTFPIVLKPNIGGSGAGIRKFETMGELEAVVNTEILDLGVDHTALLQEFLPAKDSCIIRVEILDGQFLYALRLPISADSFNYCPADGCNISQDPNLQIQAYTPPAAVIEAVVQTLTATQADLGGVEYLVNARDDQIYYYDINPLSNFVADAPNVVGFDPVVKFVDYILERVRM